MRRAAAALTIAVAGMLAVYPSILYPGHERVMVAGAAAIVAVVIAIALTTWIAMIPATLLLLGSYVAIVVLERGTVEVTAPLFGIGLVLLLEFFDLAISAAGTRAIERRAVVARLRDLVGAFPVAAAGGVIVLFAGVYGGDGGVLVAALGALCVATAFGVLTHVARPEVVKWSGAPLSREANDD